MHSSSAPRRPHGATRLSTALGLSLVLHALAGGYVMWRTTTPSLGFEFKLPSEVEFGITEGSETKPAPSEAASVAQEPRAVSAEGPNSGATRHPSPRDAGVGDAGHANRPHENDGGAAPTSDAGTSPTPLARVSASRMAESLGSPGALLALRIHMAKVRLSPLANDVRAVLAAIPDWSLLLRGSGIDPVADLDQVLIASPNLRRENIVIAGRYQGGPERVHRAVDSMASTHDSVAPWGSTEGLPSAPWLSDDPTPRTLALLGGEHFIIARPADVPRVLSAARGRAARDSLDPQAPSSTDGLLSMAADEVLSFEVEGARQFTFGRTQGVPERVRMVATEATKGSIDVEVTGFFDTPAAAEEGVVYWKAIRDAYAENALVMISGLSPSLQHATIEARGRKLVARTTLAPSQLRLLLGYLQGALTSRRQK